MMNAEWNYVSVPSKLVIIVVAIGAAAIKAVVQG
jgi:hypothetical protein